MDDDDVAELFKKLPNRPSADRFAAAAELIG
jgi:hypothetical protein